jgi:hypothetical protein
MFLWRGTVGRSGVVRLFKGSRVEIRVVTLGSLYCGGTGSTWRLQRVRLSQLCEGAENPVAKTKGW